MHNKNHKGKTTYVYADWHDTEPQLIGNLYSEVIRGKEIFAFEYTKDWLNSSNLKNLDPDLQLYSGRQYLAEEKSNFGIFLDSSPDRWGRLLMKRREAAYARQEKRNEEKLFETDFLLGVFDELRIGGLRFKENPEGPFLSNDNSMSTPPWTSLRELQEISLKIEQDDAPDDPEYINWLNMLMQPGSSLGGARPKAGVVDNNDDLWIAKFPSRFDNINIGGWERLANILALKSGINTAHCKVEQFSTRHYTFLSKRFDRETRQRRIHFASAMTLLGYIDGDSFQSGASYLDLVEFLLQNGARVNEDLEELWRRIVFSIAISNTDDQ